MQKDEEGRTVHTRTRDLCLFTSSSRRPDLDQQSSSDTPFRIHTIYLPTTLSFSLYPRDSLGTVAYWLTLYNMPCSFSHQNLCLTLFVYIILHSNNYTASVLIPSRFRSSIVWVKYFVTIAEEIWSLRMFLPPTLKYSLYSFFLLYL